MRSVSVVLAIILALAFCSVGDAFVLKSKSDLQSIPTVPALNLTQYLGLWYQVYQDLLDSVAGEVSYSLSDWFRSMFVFEFVFCSQSDQCFVRHRDVRCEPQRNCFRVQSGARRQRSWLWYDCSTICGSFDVVFF
jgi:hypothetical protein